MDRFISLLGLLSFIGVAWLLSTDRRRFPARIVVGGLVLQLGIAFFTLRTGTGHDLVVLADRTFNKLLGFANQGSALVFGPLANTPLLEQQWGPGNGFLFAITITGTIILVSVLSSLLYHYGILQLVVRAIAWVMQRLMRVSGAESLAAAANIFLGQTEAPLVIKPYLPSMSRSELLAVMVGGMASIAGSVLAAYIGLGISAAHLLTASVMSAPASLMMAKILLPEDPRREIETETNLKMKSTSVNGVEAICEGASDGMKLAINVLAMLIAFVSLVALTNYVLSLPLRLADIHEPRPMQVVLGWLNAPFAWLIGVPWKDCLTVGTILGERIVLNEFIGYLSLSKAGLEPRTTMLTTYALCGFANFSSIAIQIGGIGALAPERRVDLAQLGMKSMIGGLLACYSTAAIVGLLT
jgi:CNT family concentrative nucleoside transporter